MISAEVIDDAMTTYFTPDMRRVLVHKGLSRITEQKFRDNQKPDIFLAIKGFLKDVASIAIGGKVNNLTSDKRNVYVNIGTESR